MKDSDNISDLDDNYLEFQTHQLWATATDGCLLSGSMSELPLQYYLANITDMDQMFFEFGVCAISSDDQYPENFNKTVYTIDSNSGHPGFTRLRLGKRYLRKSEFMFEVWPINGPANKGKIVSGQRSARPIQTYFGSKVKMSTDIVNCVYCPYWPVQASEWAKRSRHSGWPSSKVIDEILKGGCHVVPKSHPCCSDDTEFRFSFSRAETVLIGSWSATQKYVYHVIRLLKKDLHAECGRDGRKSVVCTYYLKTLMLWACEKQSAAFWDEDDLEESIGELICTLIQWIIDKRCPNYFIPENNMMSHFPEGTDFEKDIAILLRIRQQVIRKRLRDIPKVTPNTSITGKTSNRLLLLMHLGLSAYRCIVHPIKIRSNQRFNLSKPRYCRIAAIEFDDLYRGIAGHLTLASDGTGNESSWGKMTITLEAEKYLSAAFIEDARGESPITVRLDDTVLDFIDSGLFDQISKSPDKNFSRVISSRGNKTKIDRLIRNNDDRMAMLSYQEPQLGEADASELNKPSNNIEYGGKSGVKLAAGTECQRQTPEELSAAKSLSSIFLFANHQLELKASYFASAAYLANFYFTLHKDCDSALDICTSALKSINKLHGIVGRVSFYMNLCAVVLSSRWMPIFDQRIQTVFGFAVLLNGIHSKQNNATKRTVRSNMIPTGAVSYAFSNNDSSPPPIIIRLIPIRFVEYIALQCTRHLRQTTEKETDEHVLLTEFCRDVSENPRSCILGAALKITQCSD